MNKVKQNMSFSYSQNKRKEKNMDKDKIIEKESKPVATVLILSSKIKVVRH